jgi:hypothetical protein
MELYTDDERRNLDQFFALTAFDIPGQIPIANAVATLALSNVQSRLPQCGIVDAQGNLTLTRELFPIWRRDVVLFPQFLLMINWADSAPGISWPETYYATYLPLVNRYIVTASQDSPDMWGVTNLAIGSFDPDLDFLEGSGEVIAAWWAMQKSHHSQARFAYVWSEGRVPLALANRWADEVWVEETEEGDE